MAVDLLAATVVGTYALTPRVKQLVLQVEGHTFEHRPGQHVSVRVEGVDDGPVYRPYSPVNLPGTNQLILAVKRYDGGTCSVWLHERTVGDEVPLLSPSGNLHLRDPDRDVAFIATGTGLTPMLSLLSQYREVGSGQAALLFGERTQTDLMYRPTMDFLAASHPHLTVQYVLSDEDWAGPTGYVQDHLDLVLNQLTHPQVYVCGVPAMVVDTVSTLRDEGVASDDIFTEGWEEGAVEV
jgi:ferredoxin-NADP reductase